MANEGNILTKQNEQQMNKIQMNHMSLNISFENFKRILN